jgi:hypothetical protein
MTKSTRKLRVLLTALLALTLCVSTVGPALAAPGDMPALEGSESYIPPVAITKIFQTPEGTIVPDATFNFDFTPYGIGSPGTDTNLMPTITSVPISVSNTDVKSTSNYIDTITQEGLFTTSLAGLDFAAGGTGQYIYTITENATVTGYDAVGNVTIYTHESEAKYELSLYVDQGTGLYIRYITVRKVMNDDGTSLGVEEEKVDPTPGAHGLAFVNTYVKANDGKPGDNTDPDPRTPAYQNLIVEKMVIGDIGQHLTSNVYFPFTVEITNVDFVDDASKAEPDLNPPLLTTYKAYVYDTLTSAIVTDLTPNEGIPAAGNDTNGLPYYSFVVGVPQDLNLKDGQQLIYTRTPVGTHWVASEMLSASSAFELWTASIEVTVNQYMDPVITGSRGGDATTLPRLVGEDDTIALFKNFEGFTPPLGITADNLPYIGLIGLAIAALAVYVVIKTRKTRKTAHTAHN